MMSPEELLMLDPVDRIILAVHDSALIDVAYNAILNTGSMPDGTEGGIGYRDRQDMLLQLEEWQDDLEVFLEGKLPISETMKAHVEKSAEN